jgi:ABC-type phosphate transport system substrate-binding protein
MLIPPGARAPEERHTHMKGPNSDMISRHKFAVGAASLAAVGTIAAVGLVGGAANADPKQYDNTNLSTVGSDTTQDIWNRLAGFNPATTPGSNFTPLQSSTLTGQKQVLSFDARSNPAINSGLCVTTKLGGPTYDRPNGSSAGRRALSRAIDGTGFGTTTNCTAGADISGDVDFARSSDGPATGDVGTALVYVPMVKDGMSFAYFRNDGNPVTELTKAELVTIYTTGSITKNNALNQPVKIIPCGIQTGSGTFAAWNKILGITLGQEATGTTACNALGVVPPATENRLQESNGATFRTKGVQADAADNGVQVIVGFSAGSYVQKVLGISTPTPPTDVLLGTISDDGNGVNLGDPFTNAPPYTVAAPPVPDTAFYASSFGRFIYNVFPTGSIYTSFAGLNAVKDIFVDTDQNTAVNNAELCITLTNATVAPFGFLTTPECGGNTLPFADVPPVTNAEILPVFETGSLLSGQTP